MRRSKKERLEAKGWRFGTVQAFLRLSDEELPTSNCACVWRTASGNAGRSGI